MPGGVCQLVRVVCVDLGRGTSTLGMCVRALGLRKPGRHLYSVAALAAAIGCGVGLVLVMVTLLR
jgi:hypothetical protein